MAESGILIGWDRVAPGHEAGAVEIYGVMITYLRALHAQGKIDSFEPVMLGAHGGQLNGFVLVRGERERLDAVRNSERFTELVVRANRTLLGFSVIRAHFGKEVDQLLRLYRDLG